MPTPQQHGVRANSCSPGSEKLTDTDLMPFGKYKGEKMERLPASYLLWLWNDGVSHPGVRAYIEDAMSALEKECPDTIVKGRP